MGEQASSIPPKGLWKLRATDFVKGLWLAVGSAVLALGYAITQNHWHMLTFDQAEPYLNTIASGFIIYIGKNWGTNNVGQFLKADTPTSTVSTPALEKLQDKADAAPPYSAPNDSTVK